MSVAVPLQVFYGEILLVVAAFFKYDPITARIWL